MDEWRSDNPAGRLHAVLTAFREAVPNRNIENAWATALGVHSAELQLALARVQLLLQSLREAVANRPNQKAQVSRYYSQWQRTIFPADLTFNQQATSIQPADDGLEALASIADFLHEVAPDGPPIPDDEKRTELVDQIQGLIQDVIETNPDELPNVVKQALVMRLEQLRKTIEQAAVGGPDAVRAAVEAVLGAMMVYGGPTAASGKSWKSGMFKSIATVLSGVWIAFGTPAALQQGTLGWENLANGHLLTAPAQTSPPQGPSANVQEPTVPSH